MQDVRALRRTPLVLAGLLVALGATKTWVGLVEPAIDVARACGWVQVPVSDVAVHVLSFHGVVRTRTEYTYRAGGRDHTGTRYAFVDPSRFLHDEAIFDLQSFAPAACWVDPEDPSRAVLVRTLPSAAYRWSGLAVVALGVALFAVARASRRSTWAARVVLALPRAWSRSSVTLAFVWLAFVGIARDAAFALALALVLGLLAVGVWRRSQGALVVLAWVGALVALAVLACAANPFALMDEAVDEANEPAFMIDYAASALLFATLGLATTLFALRERERTAAAR